MNELVAKYIEKFDDLPPVIPTLTFEDDVYQELIKRAIDRNRAIDGDDLDELYEIYELDLVTD